MKAFLQDLHRYTKDDTLSNVLFYEEAVWFLFAFRLAQWVRKYKILFPLRIPTRLLHRFMELLTGITIPIETKIGPGFMIVHGGRVVIHPKAVIGNNCTVSMGVVIGMGGKGEKKGAPWLWDNVDVKPYAHISRAVIIGEGAVIGAHAVVMDDVPADTTWICNKARMLERGGGHV